ncbi:MAG: response regulator [Myxococcales bacterium]
MLGGTGKAVRILVVDDDEAISAMLSRYLGKQGFEVLTAAAASEALEIAGREKLDAVVTDLMMPHMDGRELVRRLRALPGFAELPIIMITAYPSDAAADETLRLGASFFLPKPIDLEALATLIRFAQ